MQTAVHNTEIYGRQPTQPHLRCFMPARVNISKTCFGNRKLVHLEIAGYQTSLVLHMVALRVAASRFQGDLSRSGSGPCLSIFPVPFPVLGRPQPCAPGQLQVLWSFQQGWVLEARAEHALLEASQ